MSSHSGRHEGTETVADLVVRAREGDADAWQRLVDGHAAILGRIARGYRLRADDAADVVQTTWVRCLEHLDDLRNPELFTAWLATTCRRESQRAAIGQHRQVLASPLDDTSPLAWLPDPESGPADLAVRRDDQARLRAAIADLPARQRLVLNEFLRDGDDPYVDRSARLGIPLGSLGPTRRRAMEVLRRDARLLAAG
jgi:RNA polymerase sigma factor (sigma-70 family)